MDVIKLEAQPREAGKRAARQARRTGYVPCVLYGHHDDSVSFQVPLLSLNPLIYTVDTHRVEIVIGKKKWSCIMKQVDMHPTTGRPIHADFQVLRAGEKVHLTVPVQIHGTSVGQNRGGDLDQVLNELQVECLPKDIPSHVDLDVTDLDIGDMIRVGDISLPGVVLLQNPEQPIVVISGRAPEEPEVAELEEEEEGLEEEQEGGEE